MEIKRIEQDFTVCQVKDYSLVNLDSEYSFIEKTDEEKSLVCITSKVPENTIQRDARLTDSSLSCCVQITKRSSFHDYGKTMIFFISSSNRLATGVNLLFVVYL